LRGFIDQINPGCELEVDGGIDEKTAPIAVEAGANVLVIGTAIFAAPREAGAAIQEFRRRVSGE